MELQEQGFGKRKHRPDPVTEEEELLWSQKVLGGDTALNLNLTVIYLISQQFGTWGCQEHHQLRVKHLKFVNSPCTGTTEYVEWVQGPTKTRQAGLRKVNRRITQRMFATSDSRCPVRYLERFISKRPQHLRNLCPLYLWPLSMPKPDVWYSIQPVGINKIDGFMKMIATMGVLTSPKSISLITVFEKTTVRLQKVGVSNDKIISITGHKTEQSIKAYVDTDLEDHHHISMLLSNQKPLMEKPMSANVQPWHVPHSLAQQFGFYNCSVYTLGARAVHHRPILKSVTCAVQPSKKQRILIDSDSEED